MRTALFLIGLFLVVSTAKAQEPTFDMKAELAKLAPLDSFPGNNGFYNSQGAEFYQRLIPHARDSNERSNLIYSTAWQYLLAGEPMRALSWLDSIPDHMWDIVYQIDPKYDKTKISALCYLRLGEQKNCQENHNEFSCIMPLAEDALHIDKLGSEKAIELYTEVLSRHPDYYRVMWLLNIAYMTLGRYPDDVPEEYYIDFKKYPQDTTLPYFKNVGSELGVDMNSFYGATVIEDFNEDGFLDIFTTSGDLETNCKLYMADGKGGYTDATESANLLGITGGGNATHGDYNNDGFEDIFLIRGGWLSGVGHLHPNSMLRNNGDGTFTDVTYDVGLLTYYASQTAAFADYNNDGWLDLFVGNEQGYSQLYENQNGVFVDKSLATTVRTNALVKGCTWADYDKDGYQDLYISVFNGENYLCRNTGPDANGQYKFTLAQVGVEGNGNSFGTFFADFDNDGYQDLFVFNYHNNLDIMAREYKTGEVFLNHSSLYKNNGDGTFTDIAAEVNLNRDIEVMGLNWEDVNGDGWIDFYVGTGYPEFEALMPNLLFTNNEGKEFLEAGSSGFGHLQKGHGIGFGDMDNDGDQDVYASLGGFMQADNFWNIMLENPGLGYNWVTLDLQGVTSNRSAIGAEITVFASKGDETRQIYRVVGPGGSFGSNSLQQEIGLGDFDKIDKIEIYWPTSKTKQEFTNVEINKFYKVVEDKQELTTVERKKVKFGGDKPSGGHQHHGHHGHHHH